MTAGPTCEFGPQAVSLTDVATAATARAFGMREAPGPAPAEMFDSLCRLAGVPTIAEDRAAAHAHLIEDMLSVQGRTGIA